jgi:hypothetical protein
MSIFWDVTLWQDMDVSTLLPNIDTYILDYTVSVAEAHNLNITQYIHIRTFYELKFE